MTISRLKFRLPAAAAALALTALVGASAPAGASARTAKPNTACDLLTNAEIQSVLTDAPLDPGPKATKIPQSSKNFTRCRWDDEKKKPVPKLVAYTGVGRKLTPAQISSIGTVVPNSPGRALTAEELNGLGDHGVIEIIRDGTYGTLTLVRGDSALLISAAYEGAGTLPQVSEAQLIELARKAVPRI